MPIPVGKDVAYANKYHVYMGGYGPQGRVPVYYERPKTGKYDPHQGARERARRIKNSGR